MPNTYNRVAIWLHWISALLILSLAVFGTIMVRLGDDVAAKTTMYRVHTAVGSLVLLLTIGRIIWVFVGKRPGRLAMPRWEKLAFDWNHILLYVVVVLVAVSGTGMLITSGVSLPPTDLVPTDIQDVAARQGHNVLSKVFMALFVVHVAGVFYYQFSKGDTLSRMGVPWFKRS